MNARSESVSRLSLRPKEAAVALSISTRTLWAMTSPRGPIKCIRCGDGKRRAVLYSLADLHAFLAGEVSTSKRGDV